MPFDVKSATARPRSTYRTVRASAVQVRGMLRERGVRATGTAIARRLRQGRLAPRGTALMAATAAFKAGQDETVEAALAGMMRKYPYAAAVHELRADLLAFQGELGGALEAARLARLLEPSRGGAIAREVRYSYAALDHDQADKVAIEALHRLPRNSAVLWAVGKGCSTAEQAHRVVATWKERVPDRDALPHAVRQLASAAARGRTRRDAGRAGSRTDRARLRTCPERPSGPSRGSGLRQVRAARTPAVTSAQASSCASLPSSFQNTNAYGPTDLTRRFNVRRPR
jgi:hypothetical protein